MLTLITITAGVALASAGLAIYYRRKFTMSDAAFQKLTADVQALTAENATLKTSSVAKDAQIADLQTQLAAAQAAAGTPDADVEALDAQVQAALNPPVVPAPEPETPPVAPVAAS